MDFWTNYIEYHTERLNLQKSIFDISYSVQLLKAHRNHASDEEIQALRASLDTQQEKLYRDISYELFDLEQLKRINHD